MSVHIKTISLVFAQIDSNSFKIKGNLYKLVQTKWLVFVYKIYFLTIYLKY